MNKYNKSNTTCHTWFERDRASVRLTDKETEQVDIFELWDEAVTEFVEDGFKNSVDTWHEALIKYANSMLDIKETSKAINDFLAED